MAKLHELSKILLQVLFFAMNNINTTYSKRSAFFLYYKNQGDLMSLFRNNFSLYLFIVEPIEILFPDIKRILGGGEGIYLPTVIITSKPFGEDHWPFI